MKYLLYTLVALCGVFMLPSKSLAACATPVGSEGDLRYDSTAKMLYFCNDTNWIATTGGSGAHAFKAYRTGAYQTFSDGVWAQATFEGEYYDDSNAFAANTYTIPEDGIYAFFSNQAQVANGGSNIQSNITSNIGLICHNKSDGYHCSGTRKFSAGDTVWMNIYVGGSGSANHRRWVPIYFSGYKVN